MTAILTILASLIGLIAWSVKRRAARAADPLQQHRDRYARIDQSIAEDDAGLRATLDHWDDLDELERLERAARERLEESAKGKGGEGERENGGGGVIPALIPFVALLLLTGCSGPRVKVIPSEASLHRLPAGETFTAPVDGWFMADALYQRTRRAIADRILELQ